MFHKIYKKLFTTLIYSICDAKQCKLQIATHCVTAHRGPHGFDAAPQKRCPGQLSLAHGCQRGPHRRGEPARSRTRSQLARPLHCPAMARQGKSTSSPQKIICLFLAIAAATQLLAGCTTPQTYTVDQVRPPDGPTYGETLKSSAFKLQPGMSENSVTNLLGLPQKTELDTCGQNTVKGEWPCKCWFYEYWETSVQISSLEIMFSQDHDGSWTVNGWSWL